MDFHAHLLCITVKVCTSVCMLGFRYISACRCAVLLLPKEITALKQGGKDVKWRCQWKETKHLQRRCNYAEDEISPLGGKLGTDRNQEHHSEYFNCGAFWSQLSGWFTKLMVMLAVSCGILVLKSVEEPLKARLLSGCSPGHTKWVVFVVSLD